MSSLEIIKGPQLEQTGMHPLVRKRVIAMAITTFLVLYSVVTLFPFYVLFVRTFVSTKDATTLHLWIPEGEEEEEIMDAQFGLLAVHLDFDVAEFKEAFGIPAGELVPQRKTLWEIAEKYDIDPEAIQRYFRGYRTYNGWINLLGKGSEFWGALGRTSLITITSLAGLTVLSLFTGYGLAGLRRKYQMYIYNFYLLQIVIPPILVVVPQLLFLQGVLGLKDASGTDRYIRQMLALIIINIQGGALSTMLFTSAIGDIPYEIEESAMMDGCGRLRYFVEILLPLMKVPIASLIVIALPNLWNQFLQPFVYLDVKNTTIPPLIASMAGAFSTNFQIIYTAVFVSVLPLAIIYFLFRRLFIRSVLSGALTGQ